MNGITIRGTGRLAGMVAMLCLLVVAGCQSVLPSGGNGVGASGSGAAYLAAIRSENGLPPLKSDSKLERAAAQQAGFMASAGDMDHSTGWGKGFSRRMKQNGYNVEAPWWIILNGAVVTPLAFFCLAAGPRYISGPEVAMFYLLETVLAPVWMWMIFYEVPTRNSLIGGTILVVALVAHSLWQLHEGRKRRAAAMVRHPV